MILVYIQSLVSTALLQGLVAVGRHDPHKKNTTGVNRNGQATVPRLARNCAFPMLTSVQTEEPAQRRWRKRLPQQSRVFWGTASLRSYIHQSFLRIQSFFCKYSTKVISLPKWTKRNTKDFPVIKAWSFLKMSQGKKKENPLIIIMFLIENSKE